ncbi:MAG: hypothetical protein PHP52_11875 [Bacteroidales bacterium]|nr:hypothetical protein [Bacteroidales bacterium]MDD4216793.1 hypothetical protein [Bacteroidales bacterium]MDY0142062.1 hypothetical protein [Bacteroidales bacterium]
MRIVFLSILLLFAKLIVAQGLEFYREDISFRIENDIFYVNGLYYFCNTSADTLKHNLLYPFPGDKTSLNIDKILIVDESTGLHIPFDSKYYLEKGIYFNLVLSPYSTVNIRIFYEQKISENTIEYILTSTKAWGKPFELANYSLVANAGYKNLVFSYLPDSIDNESGTYFWKKRDFMPDKNFIVKFEKY